MLQFEKMVAYQERGLVQPVKCIVNEQNIDFAFASPDGPNESVVIGFASGNTIVVEGSFDDIAAILDL